MVSVLVQSVENRVEPAKRRECYVVGRNRVNFRRPLARSELAQLVLFYEYFHGANGAVNGASHQTGWTALMAQLIQQSGE